MNESSRYFIDCVRDLRNYAHALMGTPRQGDAYVVACLQIIRADPTRLAEESDDVRLSLFKLFHKVYDMVESGCAKPELFEDVDVMSIERPDEEVLPPIEERQVSFLVTQLGFTAEQAGSILGVPEGIVRDVLGAMQGRRRERFLHVIASTAYERAAYSGRRPMRDAMPNDDTVRHRRGRTAGPRERTTRRSTEDERLIPPAPQVLPMYYRQYYDRDRT